MEEKLYLSMIPQRMVQRLSRKCRRLQWSMLCLVACFFPLCFIPFTAVCKVLLIVVGLGSVLLLYTYIKAKSLANDLASESTRYEVIEVAELSLGGHSNYFRVRGREDIIKVRDVYGTCKVGEEVLLVTYSNGAGAVVCVNALSNGK